MEVSVFSTALFLDSERKIEGSFVFPFPKEQK
jgi:hypothetical protein